jgi:hypothetical protein
VDKAGYSLAFAAWLASCFAAGVKLFTFITIWCLLVVMPVNMTVRVCSAASQHYD